jgi:hypothetical protein
METSDDIFLLSHPDLKIDCPFCSNDLVNLNEHIFQGIHLLAKFNCPACTRSFFHTLPIGHDLLFPISFDEMGRLRNSDVRAEQWLVGPLLDSFFKAKKMEVAIEKEVFHQAEDAIILNCLDNCFGHSFFKLWNAQVLKAKYPDKSIIVFIPKRMRWLLTDFIDEVWSFDASFKDLGKFLRNLNEEVNKNLLSRFSKVFVSKAYTHLDLEKVDLKAILKTERFNLEKFEDFPPQVTFALRDDRFWHKNPLEFFVFKVFVKLGLSKKIFIWRQSQLINRTARKIKEKLTDAEFYATGLDRTGRLSPMINDLRVKSPGAQNEMQWCQLYSKSHVVIGVHGSNMLIPTALAGGFIEILPRHKIRHVAEDTLLNYNSRYTLFLGRHLDHFASPSLVADHVISMVKDFAYLYRNTQQRT